jgi:cytochrome c peroxidase
MRTLKLGMPAIALLFALVLADCGKGDPLPPVVNKGDLEDIPYSPQPYTIKKPSHFPDVPVPADNPMTVDGVQLGRRLFYDPLLSGDGTQSCSSCHLPQGSFTDNKAVSLGIDGIAGRRSSMSLLNIGYLMTNPKSGLFWDGRSKSLEEQALLPVEDPIEMHNTWPEAVADLQAHDLYPTLFRKAFGITDRTKISKELAAKAIAQFERILVSSGNSKYDQFLKEGADPLEAADILGEEETIGLGYFIEDKNFSGEQVDAQCFHCHGSDVMLAGNGFFNNGLDNVTAPDQFLDKGLGDVILNPDNNGKFRSPSLRNIAMSAPYMHDGRFQTLEQVVEHYAKKGTGYYNEDPNIKLVGIGGFNNTLSAFQKQAIVKFLHTLSDPDFVNNPDIQSPF